MTEIDFLFLTVSCNCYMDPNTQIWSMNKESWNTQFNSTQKFTSQFGIIRGFGCSTPINRSIVVFIGGHYMDVKLRLGYEQAMNFTHYTHYNYIPLKWPINDQVFQFSFLTRNWTELPKIPNIQVSLARCICNW